MHIIYTFHYYQQWQIQNIHLRGGGTFVLSWDVGEVSYLLGGGEWGVSLILKQFNCNLEHMSLGTKY